MSAKHCTWRLYQRADGCQYRTTCRRTISTTYGGHVAERGYRYCPFCTGEITEVYRFGEPLKPRPEVRYPS